MGFLDRLLGREDRSQQQGWGAPQQPQQPTWGQPQQQGYQYGQQSYQAAPGTGVPVVGGPGAAPVGGVRSEDEQAVERYRYLLRTAPPERIEEVHAEAFERLTPEQRRMVYDEFTRTAPDGEAPRGDDPRSLAQAATRSEFRQPGFMERSLGGMNGRGGMGGGFGGRQGPSFGGMLGASLLGTVAGYVIGSTLMSAFLPDPSGFDGGTDAAGDGGSGDAGDGGSGDTGAENASWDDGGGSDFGGGGGFDDLGGDFGGGFDI
ncbi:hypothetical protein [Curtobacterium sp. 9128]|uniref:hypothetical protein n=1 Tax=Curtobacterium sp. 9128 TaxID=1793722 RepID=UPI0011A693E0|nr:hypothetical protein [Curtobacterium sp. 9128]